MVKLILMGLVLFGCFAVISSWFPSLWLSGFNLPLGKGYNIPWAACFCAVPMIWMWNVKTK